jgi:hypothetical protein
MQIYKQKPNESDDEFFRRSFLAFCNEKFLTSGASKEHSKQLCDDLAHKIDANQSN